MPIPAAFDLSGRVAVVTGAGSADGIGFATARLLAELGAAVMISATTARILDRAGELRSAGFDAAGIAGDARRIETSAAQLAGPVQNPGGGSADHHGGPELSEQPGGSETDAVGTARPGDHRHPPGQVERGWDGHCP